MGSDAVCVRVSFPVFVVWQPTQAASTLPAVPATILEAHTDFSAVYAPPLTRFRQERIVWRDITSYHTDIG